MTRDPFDDLLDRSTPATRPAVAPDLEAMIAEARAEGSPRRTPRVLVAGGAIAALLVTGVGTAAATDGFSWAPWAQDPLGALPFTMATGFVCELRFSEYTGGADPAFVAQVNDALRDWYATGDVLDEVAAYVDDARAAYDDTAVVQAMDDSPVTPDAEHTAWVREWTAWDWAVDDAERAELERLGIHAGDERMAWSERSGQIQCRDLDGEPYVPGAGS